MRRSLPSDADPGHSGGQIPENRRHHRAAYRRQTALDPASAKPKW